MKVICRKAISSATGEDLGETSPWMKVGKEYIVLSMSYAKHEGILISFQTENYGDPALFRLRGFEFVSDYIPSSWITEVEDFNGNTYVSMLPASWNYESFFNDLEDEEEHAMKLFREEAEKIYREEKEYEASKNK